MKDVQVFSRLETKAVTIAVVVVVVVVVAVVIDAVDTCCCCCRCPQPLAIILLRSRVLATRHRLTERHLNQLIL